MLKQVDIYVKNSCEFLFKLMVFLAVFDGIRARTPIGDQVTIFKEISTFVLFAIILLTYTAAIPKKVLYYSNVLLLAYFVLVSTVVISINDVSRNLLPALNRKDLPAPFAMHFKNIESVIIVFVLLHYEHLTGRSIVKLLDFFVKMCVVYVLFTLVFYFFINTSFFQKPWYGRISIGYPTSDSQILSFALGFLVFGKSDLKMTFKGIAIFILIVGIVMNATATGMIAIGLIMIGYVLYYCFSGKVIGIFSVKSFLYLSLFILTIVIGKQLITSINDKVGTYSSLLETKMDFVSSKISQAVFGSTSNTSNYDVDFSQEVRETQISQAFTYNKDIASMALGGPISLGTFIENENYFLLRSYGFAGLLLYYFWIVLLGYQACLSIKQEYSRLMLVSIGILVVTNSAIITTYLYGIAVSFGLFVAYFYNRKQAATPVEMQLATA